MSDSQQKPTPPTGDGPSKWVQADNLLQIAVLLPCATFAGWGLGALVDHFLHTGWIAIAGLILGTVAGFVQVFRIVLAAKD
jgi:ATP synthase protein I